MGASKRSIDFFYDVISSYSWFAFEVLCRYQNHWNLNLKLRPVFFGGLVSEARNVGPANVPRKFAHAIADDMPRLAKYFDVPLIAPKDPNETLLKKGTLQAQRLLTAVDMEHPQMMEKVSRELWMRIWSRDEDITKPQSLAQAALKAGMKKNDVDIVLSMITETKVKDRLKKVTQEALDLGAFGVPTIVADVDGSKKWVFGSDRFHILGDLIGEKWEGPYPRSSRKV